MSVRIMTQVWEVDLPDSEKIVLLALADCANDEGLCWPSMATLARKCSKSDRTVQAAIKALQAAGHLSREERPGKGCFYTVHPQRTPEAASPPKPLRTERVAPPKGTTPTPEAASDKPSRTITPPDKADALSTPGGGSAADGENLGKGRKRQPADKPKRERKRTTGSRIGEDWQAPPVADLPLEVQSIVRQWPAGAYETTALAFRNHWLSEGRAIGAKRDWPRTWSNWLIRESATVMRAAKAGVSFAGAAPAAAGKTDHARDAALDRHLAALQATEGDALVDIRRRLKREVGDRTYDGWIKPTAFAIDGEELVITAGSAFLSGWIDTHFRSGIEQIAKHVLGKAVSIQLRVAKPTRQAARQAEPA